MGCISCFRQFSSVRPVFTTIHYYLPNPPAACFLVAFWEVLREPSPTLPTTPRRLESRSSGFPSRLLNEVSKAMQQRPGLRLRAPAATRILPDIPPRLQHCPLPYGLPQKPTAPQEGMEDTSERMNVNHRAYPASAHHIELVPWSS